MLSHLLPSLFHAPADGDALLMWRKHTSVLLLRLALLLGIPLLFFDAATHWYFQRWPLFFTSTGMTLVVLLLLIYPRIDYRLRSGMIIVGLLIGGLTGLRVMGLYGINPTIIISAVIFAALLLGARAALLLGGLGMGCVAVIFSGFYIGFLSYPYEPINHVTELRVLLNNWMLISGTMVTLGALLSSLVRTLQDSIRQAQQATAQLQQLNASLDTLVEERTAAMRQASALLSATQRIARVGGFAYATASKTLTWSDELYQIHEVPPETPLDVALLQRLYPDAWPQIDAAFRRLITTDEAYEFEVPAITMNGRPLWVRVSGVVEQLDARLHYLGAVQDITARKQVEERNAVQLRYAEALAQCSRLLLVAGSDAPAWTPVIEQTLSILRQTVGCYRIAMRIYPSSSDLLKHDDILVSDQDPALPLFQSHTVTVYDAPPGIIEDLMGGKLIYGNPMELFPVGCPLHQHYAANGVRMLLGFGLRVGGVWRGHVTTLERWERPWDEAAVQMFQTAMEMLTAFIHQWETNYILRAREAQLRAVGDNLPNGFIYQLHRDADWKPSFTYLSSGVERLLEVSPAEGLASAQTIHDLCLPEDQALINVQSREAARQGQDFKFVARHLTPSGRLLWLYMCARPRPQPDGGVLWDGVALDITERQQAADELARARDAAEAAARARASFLATMSHEIRTPLNAIIGMTTLLQDTSLDDDQRHLLATINTGGQALLAVINDILDFSRIESGYLELDCQPFDLHACLRTTSELVSHAALQKGLFFECCDNPALPQWVKGDESRLRQVLLNLLSNAVKFTNHGGITLQASAEMGADGQALVCISVRDTGIGLTAEQQQRIFAPFVQADSSTARRYGGTGLGLAITQQLVGLMGGTISVQSEFALGSTFSLRLPMPLTPALPAPAVSTMLAPTQQPLAILVAEDNAINQELMQRLLERMGHEVTLVSNGLDALSAIAQRRYDLILMDIQMPEMDGETATRHIRALGNAIAQPQIIALTAHATADDRAQALQAGMNDYLTKPVQLTALKRALSRTVATGANNAPSPSVAAPAPPPGPTLPLINWKELNALLAAMGPGAAEMLTSLTQIFAQTMLEHINALESAVATHNQSQIQRIAHRMRGGCLQLSAQALAALCQQIEAGTAATSAPLVAQLRPCYHETLAALRGGDA